LPGIIDRLSAITTVRRKRMNAQHQESELWKRRFEPVTGDRESELWRRKFEPVTGWRPAPQTSPRTDASKSIFGDAVDNAQKAAESLVKALQPIAAEARDKIKDVTSALDEAAGKSSVEVRSFVAQTLESMAEKIKPR
jgi:hypothetical protein